MVSKQLLREYALRSRNRLSRSYIKSKSSIVSSKLPPILKNKRYILSYNPYNSEIMPSLNIGRSKILFPKVIGKNTMIACLPVRGVMVKGYKKIKEPKFNMCRKINKNRIDAVIVPGLLFSPKGYRIGYGKGFYDRFMHKMHFLKVGITYDFLITDKIKNDTFDVPVDIVITNKKTIFCKLRR